MFIRSDLPARNQTAFLAHDITAPSASRMEAFCSRREMNDSVLLLTQIDGAAPDVVRTRDQAKADEFSQEFRNQMKLEVSDDV